MATKTADTKDTDTTPQANPDAIPSAPATKAETRLFQSTPGKKEWMTKDQATKAGKFWADEPKKKR